MQKTYCMRPVFSAASFFFPSPTYPEAELLDGESTRPSESTCLVSAHTQRRSQACSLGLGSCLGLEPGMGRDAEPVFDRRACPAAQLSAGGVGPAPGMGRGRAAPFPTNVVVRRHHVRRSTPVLMVQVREPVWRALHRPGIWVPSNLISSACLHWSCSCYPLCRESPSLQFRPHARWSAAGLPDAPLTSLGVESRRERLK